MSDYELTDAFLIDGGELDDLDAKSCFALGFEFAEVRRHLMQREPGEYPFHSDNYERVKGLCEKYCPGEWTILNHDDWPTLVIPGDVR